MMCYQNCSTTCVSTAKRWSDQLNKTNHQPLPENSTPGPKLLVRSRVGMKDPLCVLVLMAGVIMSYVLVGDEIQSHSRLLFQHGRNQHVFPSHVEEDMGSESGKISENSWW